MKIYEIDQAILDLIDPDTGELLDFERFNELQMERDTKIEQIAVWYKDTTADAAKLKTEIDNLSERKCVLDRRADRQKEYLDMLLCGNKFETPRCVISYRKSESTEVKDGFIAWAAANNIDLLTAKPPEPNKTEIKKYIKGGGKCPFAEIVEKQNVQVK